MLPNRFFMLPSLYQNAFLLATFCFYSSIRVLSSIQRCTIEDPLDLNGVPGLVLCSRCTPVVQNGSDDVHRQSLFPQSEDFTHDVGLCVIHGQDLTATSAAIAACSPSSRIAASLRLRLSSAG